MAPNMAMKRAAKANRRKAVVAGKRKLELVTASPASQVLRAAQMPIQRCVLHGDLSEGGMATLLLARGATSLNLTVAGFLIDALSLGVKDTFLKTVGAASFDAWLDTLAMAAPVVDVDPAYARKLLRDVTAWAASHGIAPHRDFAALEKLFGDVDAGACNETFAFGYNGKPAYIGRLDQPSEQIGRRLTAIGSGSSASLEELDEE